MGFIEAIILGVVEGITEFIPVSSTAHLILGAKLLSLDIGNEFLKTFEIVIQLGAILAVGLLYFNRVIKDRALIGKVIVAFIPTAIIGYLFYPYVKNFLLESVAIPSWALIIGGIVMVLIESRIKRQDGDKDLSVGWGQSIVIGLFQAVAIIPGVSRSAATIMGGLLMGINRVTIVEFSFLLAIPTILAASGYDLLSSAHTISNGQWQLLLVGFLVSAITAGVVIKWFMKFVQKYSFVPFGIYRIIIGLLFISWLV